MPLFIPWRRRAPRRPTIDRSAESDPLAPPAGRFLFIGLNRTIERPTSVPTRAQLTKFRALRVGAPPVKNFLV